VAAAVSAFARIMVSRKASESNILDAISVAQEVFDRDAKRPNHWLLILSDGLQEGSGYNFRTHSIDSAFGTQLLGDMKKNRTLPNLSGTRVWVAGAGGSANDASKFSAVRDFWLRYFHETGAECSPIMYGRTALVALRD